MDLIPEDKREEIFRQKEAELTQISLPLKVTCFRTSIWDETLYKAWSSIVYSLIPNIQTLEAHLNKFCSICEADEVVIFERATFLVIAYCASKKHRDDHRFEKISNIIKQFKLGCRFALFFLKKKKSPVEVLTKYYISVSLRHNSKVWK